MYRLSYIICYRHQEDRYKNLLKVTKYLRDIFNDDIEIILVEQGKTQLLPNPSLFDQHIFTYSERPFNRSWAFNVGAKYCTSDKIFFGDCDLICDKRQMEKSIELLNSNGCVSPYKLVVDLNPSESEIIDINKWNKIDRIGRGGINLTGGIVGFRKDDFYKIAGWCERFESWGGEDDFQTWKVKNWLTFSEVDGKVFHLYHTRAQIDQNLYRKNLEILQSINTKDSQEIINWINNSRISIGDPNKYLTKSNIDEYADYLRGKKVCIIGPAPSIIGSNQQGLIESYDVVVRLNKAIPVPQERIVDVGSRTDIYYHCMSQIPLNCGPININYLKNEIKFISSPYPNIPPFDRDITAFNEINDTLKFHIIDKDMFLEISKKMDTRPNTGVSAIIDLLSFDIKELYITGFTFFKGGYDKTYTDMTESMVHELNRQYGVHKIPPQIEYLSRLYQTDDRIKVDNELLNILNK